MGAAASPLLIAAALLFICRVIEADDDAPAVVVKVTKALKVSAQSSLVNMTFDPVSNDDDATLNALAQACCLDYTPATSTTQTRIRTPPDKDRTLIALRSTFEVLLSRME